MVYRVNLLHILIYNAQSTKMDPQTSFRLSYSSSSRETRETILDIEFSFQDPDTESLKKKINTWLTAIGVDLQISE